MITRFAPSPTGKLHIGGLRTALYAYALAKNAEGRFILRYDDTDVARSQDEYKKDIRDKLNHFKILPNRIITQSHRLSRYTERAQFLVDNNYAYKKDHAVYLKIDNPIGVEINDELRKKPVKFTLGKQDERVLLKSDGYPTYHLASVVDDIDCEVTHILRGDEWLSSAPIHKLLYERFDAELPKLVHLPLILNEEGKKLSKRNHSDTVWDLDNLIDNYDIDVLTTYIMSLGWGPSPEKVSKREELIKQFSLDKLRKSPAKVSLHKLDSLQKIK